MPETKARIVVTRPTSANQAVVERILREKIYISLRYTAGIGGIRASTHFYNDEEDVMELVWAVKKAVS